MTNDDTKGMELDCYEAVEAVDHHEDEVIHLGMDVQEIEGGQTYWNVYVPTRWDKGQRLVLLSQEEFRAVGNVLLLEALAMPQYSVLSTPEANLVNNLVAPVGKFHLDETLRQCPEDHGTVLDRLGDFLNIKYSCSDCGAIYDDSGELVTTFGDWEQIEPNTQEFDDTLGIVRNEAMEVIDDPNHILTPRDDEEEARQAYEDYGGPNHSNHDDYQE